MPPESNTAPAPQPPLVSAIVLSYNRREEMLLCLASLRGQTYPRLEVVVLDNASADGSADAIERDFPEFRLLRMPRNYGDWEGRDIALANCKGCYVVCIDDDATMEPDVVEKLVHAMEQDPQLAVVEPRVIHPTTGESFSVSAEWADVDHYRANFMGGAAMYRTSALREVGGFPHYLLGGAEAHLTLRFLDRGYRILHTRACTIFNTESPTARVPHQRFFLRAKQRLRAYMSHYPGFLRPLADFVWKVGQYAAESLRRGYYATLPRDLAALVLTGFSAWLTGPERVKRETVNLHDYLQLQPVTSLAAYEQIPRHRSVFWQRARFRLTPAGTGSGFR